MTYQAVDDQEGQEGHWEQLPRQERALRLAVVVHQHLGAIRRKIGPSMLRTNLHQWSSRLHTWMQRSVRNTAAEGRQTWRKWWKWQPRIRTCHELWYHKQVNALSLDDTCVSKSRTKQGRTAALAIKAPGGSAARFLLLISLVRVLFCAGVRWRTSLSGTSARAAASCVHVNELS